MPKLKTETNTTRMFYEVMSAAHAHNLDGFVHESLDANFEHGQWWLLCASCGASWSVVDAEVGASIDGLDFEQIDVDAGDESCAAD